MRRDRAIVVVLVLLGLVGIAAPRGVAASTPLEGALELYAAAAYEEALAAFDTVSTAALGIDDQVVVAQHRMLCLMAMGRTAEAERAATSLLALRPEFVLAAHDASPRVRTMFDTARRRVLPAILRERFAAGRRLYDAGARAEARAAFASVSEALDDAALVESETTLADLRTLADGFLVLTSAAVPAAEPANGSGAARVVAAPVATAPDAALPTLIVDESSALVSFPTDSAVAWHEDGARAPVGHASEAAAASEPSPMVDAAMPEADAAAAPTAEPSATADAAPASSAAPAPATAVAAGAPFTPIDIFTYDWRDKDVTGPVPVAQAVSGWWGAMGEPPAGTPLGAVEVVIDEHGRVTEAKMYQSVNRVYDAVLLASVGQWRYQPATRGGRPVKYRRISGVVSGR